MPTKTKRAEKVRSVARERFGFEELSPGQELAISSVLDKRDTLAVMPTGSGKSAIYQIAGLLMPGATLVVSPLIALQRDQVESIEGADAGDATEINSTVSESAREEVFARLADDEIEFILLAPEQFSNDETMARLSESKVSLIVVDEAHCISEWGHDFRPDYLRLGAVVDQLGHPTVLALTATASPPVREEIVERLGMRDANVIVQGFDRPNLDLAVETFADEDDKREALLERVMASRKPGIVYTATRKATEEIAAELRERGIEAAAYHAGLKASEREERQTWFMEHNDAVMVATVAFGMGIDKSNVRFVHHYDIPGSIDAYYQEIGRGGRDSEPAEAVLFYRPEDLALRRFQGGGGVLEPEEVELVVETLLGHEEPVTPSDLHDETGLSDSKLTRMLDRLEDAGVIASNPDGSILPIEAEVDPEQAAKEAVASQKNLNRFAQSRVEMMRAYAEQEQCRRAFLLNYFGEAYDPPCGHCDNCRAGRVSETPTADHPFPVNSIVIHEKWGEGRVMRHEGETMIVLFETVGYRTLDVALVQSEDLLRLDGDGR